MAKEPKWTVAEDSYLHQHFPADRPEEIAQHLGRPLNGVKCRAHKLKIRKAVGYRKFMRFPSRRKHLIPDDLFTTLTPDLTYILGFIYADGCIHGNHLGLANTDHDLLTLMLQKMKLTNPISLNRKGKFVCYKVEVYSAELVERLRLFGLTERKSLTCRMPTISDDLFFHFFRGYFDGDGCAYYSKKTGLSLSIVSGSPPFLAALAAQASRITGFDPPTTHARKDLPYIHHIWYYGRNALRIADAMYANAGDLFMKRKHERFERYRNRNNPCNENYYTFKGETHLISEWATITGIKERTIRSRLNRKWSIEATLTTPILDNTTRHLFYGSPLYEPH